MVLDTTLHRVPQTALNVQLVSLLRGKGAGVPRLQIMENEFECQGERKGHDGHLAVKLQLFISDLS